MQYWLPHWRIVQLCKITLADGTVGWGETIPNYTWAKVPEDIEDRIVGRAVGDLLWEDALGAGVQQALFDAVGKVLGAPAYRLLGHQGPHVVSAVVVGDGHAGRGLGAPVCGRGSRRVIPLPSSRRADLYDLHACIEAIVEAVPPQFKLDLDFNGTLANAASAVEFLAALEQYPQVAMIETPIPQGDVAGNAQIRNHIRRPLAMHYGSPPILTTLQEDVAERLCGLRWRSRHRPAIRGRRRGQQALLAPARRHGHYHYVGRSLRRSLSPEQMAGHYLHEHLGKPAFGRPH